MKVGRILRQGGRNKRRNKRTEVASNENVGR